MRLRRSISLVAVGVLALAACSSEATTTSTPSTTETDRPVETTTPPTASTTDPGAEQPPVETTSVDTTPVGTTPSDSELNTEPIDVDAAVAALQLAADTVSGEPLGIESDDHDGRDTWEISLAADATSVTVWISIDGTEVMDQERDDEPDDDVALLQSAEVSAIDALQTIAPLFSGTLDQLELDTRDGDVVWEIEIDRADRSSFDVIVDAVTGAVVGVSDATDNEVPVATSDLDGFVEYQRIVQEVAEIATLVAVVETDNPNSRVIIFSEEGNPRPSYRSVFVKDQNRLKLIALDGRGVILEELL